MIVTLLAEDGRQVRAVAKGMRKPTSRFAGRLQPYATADLLLHTGKSLEAVSDVRSTRQRSELREDYERNAAAAVVVDLLGKISLENQAEERLFALASVTLDAMAVAPIEALPRLVIAFLLKAMAMHGYRPELESCAACAAALGHDIAFSMPAGGLVCAACGSLDASAISTSFAARDWLATLLGSTMAEVTELDMEDAAVVDVFSIVRAFIAYHVPARLKALDFYAGMLP